MVPYLLSYKQFLKTKEQAKVCLIVHKKQVAHSMTDLSGQRSKEVQDKTPKAIEEVISARKDSMMYLRDIMTAPEKQGRGYASALIRIVTAKVTTISYIQLCLEVLIRTIRYPGRPREACYLAQIQQQGQRAFL